MHDMTVYGESLAKLKAATNPLVAEQSITLPSVFTIRAINTANEQDERLLKQIGQLRYSVWRDECMDMSNANDDECMIDSIDENAILWAVFHNDDLVATARLNLYDDLSDSPTSYMHDDLNARYALPVATFTRLVVVQNFQGMKIGKALDALRLKQAQLLGAKSIMLMCPPYRADSLVRKGYQCLGKAKPSKLWPDAQWMVMVRDL